MPSNQQKPFTTLCQALEPKNELIEANGPEIVEQLPKEPLYVYQVQLKNLKKTPNLAKMKPLALYQTMI